MFFFLNVFLVSLVFVQSACSVGFVVVLFSSLFQVLLRRMFPLMYLRYVDDVDNDHSWIRGGSLTQRATTNQST